MFQTDWYLLDAKSRYYVLFIIMRAQKPLGFNIGPFPVMTTGTGLSVV